MRYSTVPAVDIEAQIARNRELIQALPPTSDNSTMNSYVIRYEDRASYRWSRFVDAPNERDAARIARKDPDVFRIHSVQLRNS